MKRSEPTLAEDCNVVEGSYDMYKDWVMDGTGYFLIRVNEKEKRLEIGLCKAGNVIETLVHGKTPQEVYYTACEMGLVSRLDHAAYLGKELEKAFLSLRFGIAYTQDAQIETLEKPKHPEKH